MPAPPIPRPPSPGAGGEVSSAEAARGEGNLAQGSRQAVGGERCRGEEGDHGDDAGDQESAVEGADKRGGRARHLDLERAATDVGRERGRQRLGGDARREAPRLGDGRAGPIGDTDDAARLRRDPVRQDAEGSSVDTPSQALLDDRAREVEALLLARAERLLQRPRRRAVHDHAGDEQHDDDDTRQQQRQPYRQRSPAHHGPASRPATSRYPVAGTVSMSHGSPGSSPSLRRRLATWTSTTRSYTSSGRRATTSSSC